MPQYEINWPEWKEIINESFVPLIENKDRYLILWGGRGSSKSDFAAKKLIYRCVSEQYFRCVLVRRQFNSIRESQFQTLKDIIFELGLQQLFEFRVSPQEIICKNGNRFICRGCDDTTLLKSIHDFSCVWYEEDLIEESDFITITTSIRTSKADYLQEIFTINPEVEGDYTQHWFWKRFFEDKEQLNFSDSTRIEIEKDKFIALGYTSHHSTYKDNRWIPGEFIAFLMSMKESNPYYFTIYSLGRWGNKIVGGQMYKLFSIAKNVSSEIRYNPDKAIWLSFDFNTLPGVSCGIFQMDERKLLCIDEIQLTSPKNTTKDVCAEFIRRYQGHKAGLFVTGDPSGRHNDTRTEKGYNDFTLIIQALKEFIPNLKVALKAEPVVMRVNFINTVFHSGYEGCEIIISDKCTKMINDLLYGLEASDGTKLKQRVKDPNTGATMEKNHHFTDLLDYACTMILSTEYHRYLRGGKEFKITTGKNISKNNDAWGPSPSHFSNNDTYTSRGSKWKW